MASDEHALILQISADVKGLEKALARASGEVKKRSKEMTDAGTSLERFFQRPQLGKALDEVFDRTRLKVLDSGVARVGLFGSALERAGVVGFAAAAGIGAFAFAMAKTQEAINVADELDDTSAKLKIGVEDLQAYGHAFGQVGIEVQAGRSGLQSLTAALGAVNQNLPRSERIAKVFATLGISREQLRSYQDGAQLLPLVAEGFNKLDTAAQAAVAKALGIDALLPLLRENADGITRLTDEARKLGIVMDEALVKKGAEAADKLRTLDEVMKTQTNVAFVEFADTLVSIKQFFVDAEKAGLSFLAHLTNTVPLQQKIADLKKVLEIQKASAAFGDPRKTQALIDDLEVQQRLGNPKFQSPDRSFTVTQPAVLPTERAGGRGRAAKTDRQRFEDLVAVAPFDLEAFDRTVSKSGTILDIEKVGQNLNNEGPDELNRFMMEYHKRLHDETFNAVRGGLEALRSDGIRGLLDYFGQRLEESILDSVAEGLTQGLLRGGAGGGGFFSSLFSGFFGLFTGFHASGGYIPPGKWGIAGERGAEPVFGGRTGATVMPNSALGGSTQVVVHVEASPYFDARVEQRAGPIAARAASVAYSAANRAAPGQVSAHQKYRG